MSPITIDGIVDGLRQSRREKLAVVGLLGCMGDGDAGDALRRLRDAIEALEAIKGPDARRKRSDLEDVARDVLAMAREVEPWLAQVAAR